METNILVDMNFYYSDKCVGLIVYTGDGKYPYECICDNGRIYDYTTLAGALKSRTIIREVSDSDALVWKMKCSDAKRHDVYKGRVMEDGSMFSIDDLKTLLSGEDLQTLERIEKLLMCEND